MQIKKMCLGKSLSKIEMFYDTHSRPKYFTESYFLGNGI